MAFTVIQSETPVVPDTLPALKTRWYRAGATPRIYTTARFYLLRDSLQLSLAVFEREPPADSRAGFAFGGAGNAFAAVFLAPNAACLALLDGRHPPPSWPEASRNAPPLDDAAFFAGQDEQGWYWGAQLAIGPQWLRDAGIHPAPGERFGAAVAKYSATGDGLGLSFPLPQGAGPLERPLFTVCTIAR